MELEQILNYIANNGLAVVLCLYMVIHNTKIVKENTETLRSLKDLIEVFITKQGG